MISVRLEHIRKSFGSVVAVRDVSLHVEPGEIFFLLGPSGCGKTTLLRCIAGFGEPDSGRIFFGERDVTHAPPEKRNCGMVFQSYALWPHMTVSDNVGFGLDVRKIGGEERGRHVRAALERVQLAQLAERKPNQLSGGQQQRVALARALVIEPDCLLLDEPLSNLDAKLRGEMRLEIRSLCKRSHLTAIYVTHDQKEALAIADRIAVLKDGDVQQVGTPEDLYRRPATRFVADFVGETNFIDGHVESGGQGVWSIRTGLGALRGRCAAPLEAGRPVTCSIRPESIRLRPDGNGAASESNHLLGTVVESVYLGDVAQHLIRVACPPGRGPQVLRASELNPATARGSAGRTTPDQSLALSIAIDDVVVLAS
jgi:iron(III) transport system ATP-binding protein